MGATASAEIARACRRQPGRPDVCYPPFDVTGGMLSDDVFARRSETDEEETSTSSGGEEDDEEMGG